MSDYVKVYRERFWSLWSLLKKINIHKTSCKGNCFLKKKLEFSDCIIQLHKLARTIEDPKESLKVIKLADELAQIGNRLQEKNLEFENPEKIA